MLLLVYLVLWLCLFKPIRLARGTACADLSLSDVGMAGLRLGSSCVCGKIARAEPAVNFVYRVSCCFSWHIQYHQARHFKNALKVIVLYSFSAISFQNFVQYRQSSQIHANPPHIIIAVVYIFISLYVYIFPVPRIVATALNIWENNDIFLF